VLNALTYGLVSSLAADPIEKKPVFHYRPGTSVFSVGSVGCSMRCGHCQNWQISRPKGDDGSVPLRFLEPAHAVQGAVDSGCEGIAWTYNEPVIWPEYVLDCARLAHEAGLYTVMVTNGYVTEAGLDEFARHIDVWRTDVKGYSEATYRHLCHVAHPEAVRAAAERALHVHGMHVECVTNVVPTVNDSDGEIEAVAHWIANALSPDVPWHVTRFVPYLEFAALPPTPIDTLERARDIGRREGLHHIYLGNVDVPGGEDSHCPSCGRETVSRRGFSAKVTGLDGAGRCEACGGESGIRL
jgi:pyruvate formate lyase activating enzyme